MGDPLEKNQLTPSVRVPASLSVSALLVPQYLEYTYNDYTLMLGRRVDSGLICPIGGGYEFGDTPVHCIKREAEEELGRSFYNALPIESLHKFVVMVHQGESKLSIGISYYIPIQCKRSQFLPFIPTSEISELVFCDWKRTLYLVMHPDELAKPEFNVPLLLKSLYGGWWGRSNGTEVYKSSIPKLEDIQLQYNTYII